MKTVKNVLEVVNGGYCVGCGACVHATGGRMVLNQYGEFIPDLHSQIVPGGETADRVCPSLNPEENEDYLASRFLETTVEKDESIGFYRSAYAGFVREGNFRASGTSGGMGTWIGFELLRKGLIDGVIHVKETKDSATIGTLFSYAISKNEDEIRDGAKTKYHVVELSEILAQVGKRDGRFLFIGVPCMCKAIRRIQLYDETISKRIVFVVSLVCGHLKSVHWTTSLAWAKSVSPGQLRCFQYRTKGDGIPARAYVYRATPKDTNLPIIQQNSADVTGGKYNSGALMLPACDYCDDVVGETSDLTIGDAWIPKFEVDDNGTNLLIVRNPVLLSVLENAASENRIHLTPITGDDAAASQSGGLRHRREGLSYRLSQKIAKDEPVPVKRVKPGQFSISRLRRRVYDQRSRVVALSRTAFREALDADDYEIYRRQMQQPLRRLRSLEVRSIFFRALRNRLERIVLRFTRRFPFLIPAK